MDRHVRNERGIALAIAIFALVVVGALVAGAFFAGTQEQRLAENAKRVTQSFGIAEAGIAEQVRVWDPVTFNQQRTYPLDSAFVRDTTAPSRTGSYNGYVYKLNDNLFLTDIRGNDATPTAWLGCDPPGPPQTGVRTGASGDVTTSGNGTVDGSPPALRDPGLGPSTFTDFGDVTFQDLVDRAQVRLPGGTYRIEPSVTGLVCNRADPTNWGDGLVPTNPCGNYFPIVYIDGDLTTNGVQGQGILLVRGNLSVQGSFEFFGITIALGQFSTAGGGTSIAHFWGGVLASNASLDTQNLSGQATLNFSSCAIQRALQATGVTAPLRSRGWVALY
jgi:hypothetical protein